MLRLLHTGASNIGEWACERPLEQEGEALVVGLCARDRTKSTRRFITAYTRG